MMKFLSCRIGQNVFNGERFLRSGQRGCRGKTVDQLFGLGPFAAFLPKIPFSVRRDVKIGALSSEGFASRIGEDQPVFFQAGQYGVQGRFLHLIKAAAFPSDLLDQAVSIGIASVKKPKDDNIVITPENIAADQFFTSFERMILLHLMKYI